MRPIVITIVLALLAGCADADPAPPGIDVRAAASTTEVLSELATRFEQRTGTRVRLSFSSSSTAARQVESGAPADVYVSADPRWMDHLEQAGLIVAESRRDLLANEMVLVGELDGRVAIGDPDTVPAGRYAREVLEHLGRYDELRPRLVTTIDVRAALRLAERGEVDGAIVYATDATASDAVEIAERFGPETHSPIVYPAALVRDASPEAGAFLDFLTSDESAAVYAAAGFRRP